MLQVGGAPVEEYRYRRAGCLAAESSILPKPYVCRWKAAMSAYNEVKILEELHGSGWENASTNTIQQPSHDMMSLTSRQGGRLGITSCRLSRRSSRGNSLLRRVWEEFGELGWDQGTTGTNVETCAPNARRRRKRRK